MSNKNHGFKKLLAAICGVASTLGGNAASAKGSNVKPANSAKNLAPAQGNILVKWLKDNPGKSGAILGGGLAFVATSILGVRYLLKDKEKQDDGSGGGNPQKSQDNPQDGSKKGNPQGQKKTDTTPPPQVKKETNTKPPQHNVYGFAFDQVKIKNFKKRDFLNKSKGGIDMADTTSNDVNRDEAFLKKLRDAGVGPSHLSPQNFAAFTSNDKGHSRTIYVVNAPRDSEIRNNFVTAASKTKDLQMLHSDEYLPDLLFFFAQRGGGFFGSGTSWNLLSSTFSWGNQGTIRFFVGTENNAPELK